MENLHALNLRNNLIEEFSRSLIAEWFTAGDTQEPLETQNSNDFSLILNENRVSTLVDPIDGRPYRFDIENWKSKSNLSWATISFNISMKINGME